MPPEHQQYVGPPQQHAPGQGSATEVDRAIEARQTFATPAGPTERGAQRGKDIGLALRTPGLLGEPQSGPQLANRRQHVTKLAKTDAPGLMRDRRLDRRRSTGQQSTRGRDRVVWSRQSERQQIFYCLGTPPSRRHSDRITAL